MDDSCGVFFAKACWHCSCYSSTIIATAASFAAQCRLFDNPIKQFSTTTHFRDDMHLVLIFVNIVYLNNVGMVHLFQEGNLPFYSILSLDV